MHPNAVNYSGASQDPVCRVALDWLSSLAVVAVDGAIAWMAHRMAGELPRAVGSVIAQAAELGPEVIAVLEREPQAELQGFLDVLEPATYALSTFTHQATWPPQNAKTH